MKIVAVICTLIVALVLYVWFRSGGYYKPLFADEHKKKIYDWLSENVNADATASEGVQMVSDEGLAIFVTKSQHNTEWVLHVSFSETRGYTTGAAASVFGKLISSTIVSSSQHAYRPDASSHARHIAFQSDSEQFAINPLFNDVLEKTSTTKHFDFPVVPVS